MKEVKLAKIESAKFGCFQDRDFLFGMILGFSGKGWGVGCGGRYTINMSKDCRWKSDAEKKEWMEKTMQFAYDTIQTAKVDSVEELVGIPVEVTLEKNTFESFRILTEVL